MLRLAALHRSLAVTSAGARFGFSRTSTIVLELVCLTVARYVLLLLLAWFVFYSLLFGSIGGNKLSSGVEVKLSPLLLARASRFPKQQSNLVATFAARFLSAAATDHQCKSAGAKNSELCFCQRAA